MHVSVNLLHPMLNEYQYYNLTTNSKFVLLMLPKHKITNRIKLQKQPKNNILRISI
jgi:hypothetical protein